MAPINSDGSLGTEVSTTLQAVPTQLEIAAVDDRAFIFASEGASGTEVLQFCAFVQAWRATVAPVATIPGNSKVVKVSGSGQFPVLFIRRYDPNGQAPLDVYDTRWLTQSRQGQPLLGTTIDTAGYAGYGFAAYADLAAETAYVYLLAFTSPEQSVTTFSVGISCLVDDPLAPPTSNLKLENISAQAREGGDIYFGDQWNLTDQSGTSPSARIDQIQWDVDAPSADPSTFSADPAPDWQGA